MGCKDVFCCCGGECVRSVSSLGLEGFYFRDYISIYQICFIGVFKYCPPFLVLGCGLGVVALYLQ